ncbi:glycine-rich cell wall structural protein-like [Triticum dicoccoides]|uniref:glycine-rich cell wall structural protein-like n=1 Tax=Triticum dicoccoides TaxID=85692 RepID=UPI000E7AD4A5|nr:glycine-rich cell wall structural protein-like [Triticum dicoccoides]
MASKGLVVFAVLLLAASFLVATAEQTQAKKETQAGVQVGYDGGGGSGDGNGYAGHAAGGIRCCRHNCYRRTSCRCCTPDEIAEEVRH